MKKKKSKFIKKNLGRLLISFSLFVLWGVLTASYLLTFDISFSNLSYNHQISDFNKISFSKLYKGDEISGEFLAKDNNLGIVSLRFQTYIRPPYEFEDIILFRIKEKGSRNWYYENTYKNGLIYNVPLFPFGFPQIADSKGKKYEFQIVSVKGNSINAISLKNQFPVLETKYKYSGKDLIHNKAELLKFSIQKTYNAFQVPDVWFSSLIYLLPFIFYLFSVTSLGRRLLKPFNDRLQIFYKKFKKISQLDSIFRVVRIVFLYNFDIVIISLVLIDIFIMQLNNDVAYLVITYLWIVTVREYRLSSKQTFITGSSFLLISPIFLLVKIEPTAEKAAVWAFLFFVAGIVQNLIELKSKRRA